MQNQQLLTRFFLILFLIPFFYQCSDNESLNEETSIIDSTIESKSRECDVYNIHKELFNEHPELAPEANASYKELADFTEQFIGKGRKENVIYKIPVVVHIVHDNGAENISDAAVIGGINDLNDGMKGRTQNESFIQPEFIGIKSTDAPIEFVLAKYNPAGNPTTGIIRHQNSEYTVAGDNLEMKRAYNWPREKYLNIYITRKARATSNTSGFAFYPYSVDSEDLAYKDGVVLAYWAFGRHAELYNEWFYLVTHEVGHWLNLIHVWGEVANGSRRACRYDDNVSDTPNTQGNAYQERSQCGDVETSCDSVDNTTNHMDYCSPCQAMFTEGQMSRMIAALNSPVANRNNLWSTSNLDFTLNGIDDGGNTGGNCDSLGEVQNLIVTKLGNSGKKWGLTWGEVTNAEAYDIQYRRIGQTWIDISTQSTSYTISGINSKSTYEVRIRAKCGAVVGNWSAIVQFN